jgi:hypothetical protein
MGSPTLRPQEPREGQAEDIPNLFGPTNDLFLAILARDADNRTDGRGTPVGLVLVPGSKRPMIMTALT